MIKIILQILRPKVAPPAHKKELPTSVKIYVRMLLVLARYYHKYAISDYILIGSIKCIHTVRDLKFEEELSRMHIDTKPHMDNSIVYSLRQNIKPITFRPFYSFFRFIDELTVVYEDKELIISRTNGLNVFGSNDVKLKKSTAEDLICRTHIQISPKKERPIAIPKGPKPSDTKIIGSKHNTSLLGKESYPTNKINSLGNKDIIETDEVSLNTMESITVKKCGFEIDTDF